MARASNVMLRDMAPPKAFRAAVAVLALMQTFTAASKSEPLNAVPSARNRAEPASTRKGRLASWATSNKASPRTRRTRRALSLKASSTVEAVLRVTRDPSASAITRRSPSSPCPS